MKDKLLQDLRQMQSDLEIEDKHFKALVLRALEEVLGMIATLQADMVRLRFQLSSLLEQVESNISDIMPGEL